MHTARGTSMMRPTRSIAMPGVTCTSKSWAPRHVHAGVLPSTVTAPMTEFQYGIVGALVSADVVVSIWKLPFGSTITEGTPKAAFGSQLGIGGPAFVQVRLLSTIWLPRPGGHAGCAPPLVPSLPVFTWMLLPASTT